MDFVSWTDKFATWIAELFVRMTRRKVIHYNPLESQLKRVLTTWGIILFGIGQMSGGGPFIVSGPVAQMAGPGMVLSFAIAGIVALLSAVCFAEFASAVPLTGSGYLYTYVTMGEFMAFFVGWQLMLDQILAVASVCSAISGAINVASSDAIKNWTLSYIGTFRHTLLASYPDLLGVVIAMLGACAMSFGLHKFALVSNLLIMINLLVTVFCIGFGFAFADTNNWTYRGFLPNGFQGVMEGACNSFTAYIGFEGMAAAGEETHRPRRSIPKAILIALCILVVLYVLMAAALTLEMPFDKISTDAAFPVAFLYHGYYGAMVVVSVGIALGMFGSLIGSVYAVGRTGYAMASDGLFFRMFGQVAEDIQSPLVGEITFALIAALFALVFDLKILVEFQNAGTLMAYTIIAGCSIIFHYQPRVRVYGDTTLGIERFRIADPKEMTDAPRDWLQKFEWFFPKFAVDIALVCFAIFVGLMFAVTIDVEQNVPSWAWWPIIPGLFCLTGALLSFCVIFSHPIRHLTMPFQMPFPTVIPMLSMLLNIWLLVYVAPLTWMRIVVWIFLGLLVYFAYGIRHSRVAMDQESVGTDAPGGVDRTHYRRFMSEFHGNEMISLLTEKHKNRSYASL